MKISARNLMLAISIIFLVGICFSWSGSAAFFDTAVSVNAGITKTDGTEIESNEILLIGKSTDMFGITVVFDRAAGTSSTVDVDFEVCFSGRSEGTWATLDNATFKIPTNEAVVTGTTVRVFKRFDLNGVSRIKVKSIYNSDGANNITGVNAYISY